MSYNFESRNEIGYTIPQTSILQDQVIDIVSMVSKLSSLNKIYGIMQVTVQVFEINGKLIVWATGFKPYITDAFSIFTFSALSLSSKYDIISNKLLFDKCKSRRVKLRYLDKITFANLQDTYKRSHTEDVESNIPDLEEKCIVYVRNMYHESYHFVNNAILHALGTKNDFDFDELYFYLI